MARTWKFSILLLAGLTLLLPSLAGTASPWDEAPRKPLDRADFSGRLNAETLENLIREGEALFAGKFTTRDGVGRPMEQVDA